jgi:hypothetical protein
MSRSKPEGQHEDQSSETGSVTARLAEPALNIHARDDGKPDVTTGDVISEKAILAGSTPSYLRGECAVSMMS